MDFLTYPHGFLFERYRFSRHSIEYIHNLIHPYIRNISHHGCALTSKQMLCVALRFFANGSFLYNIGDAEHISKATVCRTVRKVCLALKRFQRFFCGVSWPQTPESHQRGVSQDCRLVV